MKLNKKVAHKDFINAPESLLGKKMKELTQDQTCILDYLINLYMQEDDIPGSAKSFEVWYKFHYKHFNK